MRTCGRSLLREKHSWWLFFFFLQCGILVLPPGIGSIPPALGARGLNHWPTSEVPKEPCFSLQMEKGKERKRTQGNSPGLWRGTERVVYFPISHTHMTVCFPVSHIDTHTEGCVFPYFSHIHTHTQKAVSLFHTHTDTYHTLTYNTHTHIP